MPQGKPYHFHPAAWDEFEDAQKWYRSRDPETGLRFLSAVYDALEDISRWPQSWPEYFHGTRKFVLRRFPYLIVYREKESVVQVLAIAHGRRRPGYWKERV
jgi:toxin ParE1/3/4